MHLQATAVGIDDMAVYIPQLYLPIESLADARNLEYAKLNQGLGLTAMSLPDVREDAATMMANAVLSLIRQNHLNPNDIGRIYLGTESALDGAKPTATFALEMLSSLLSNTYGDDCLLHCDVVDLTFACIGAVDALQNTLDWVRADNRRIGIVVASDVAKYELGSGGEYTQGAGAIALLVKANPRLMRFEGEWGVATRPVFDFFKPLRKVYKHELVAEILQLADRNHVDIESMLAKLDQTISVQGVLDSNEAVLQLHRSTPVFDGPYSNDCYQQRIREALQDYKYKNSLDTTAPVAVGCDRLAFHLPYAYQARRMFGEIFLLETIASGDSALLEEQTGMAVAAEGSPEWANMVKAVTKTTAYRQFVNQRIENGERASSLMGNLYTGSLFLSIMSLLEAGLADDTLKDNASVGCFAYGSGSKSKVFIGLLQPEWRSVTAGFQLSSRLAQRRAIDYSTYEKLHRGQIKENLAETAGVFYLRQVHEVKDNQEGMRTYGLSEKREVAASNTGVYQGVAS